MKLLLIRKKEGGGWVVISEGQN